VPTPLPLFADIHTARLVIRAVAGSDLADLLEVNGDDEVTRYLPYATWRDHDDALAWLARMQERCATGTARQYVIERRPDRKVIGTVLRRGRTTSHRTSSCCRSGSSTRDGCASDGYRRARPTTPTSMACWSRTGGSAMRGEPPPGC